MAAPLLRFTVGRGYLLVCAMPAFFSSRAACAAASRARQQTEGEQET